MTNKWFTKLGWVYRPHNIIGWILVVITLVLIVQVFLVVDRNSHSVSDALIGTFPWAWIFLASLNWIVSKTN